MPFLRICGYLICPKILLYLISHNAAFFKTYTNAALASLATTPTFINWPKYYFKTNCGTNHRLQW